jgi:hypothetical protein
MYINNFKLITKRAVFNFAIIFSVLKINILA